MSPDVQPVPEGCENIIPHLVIDGAAEAIEFYKRAFGAREVSRQEGPGGKILHADLKVGGGHVFLNDQFGEASRNPKALGGSPVTLHLYVEDVDAVFARAVEAGAEVTMPVMDAFWGDRYGRLRDPYGHEWSLATHVRDLTPEEITRAAADRFSQGGD